MDIKLQVTGLELSKRLKELGVNQESLFYWEKCPDAKYEFVISYSSYHDLITGEYTDCHVLKNQENYSAFTEAELGEMLPKQIEKSICSDNDILILTINYDITWNCWYEANYYTCDDIISSENLADCLAKMMIYLIENNIINVKKEG